MRISGRHSRSPTSPLQSAPTLILRASIAKIFQKPYLPKETAKPQIPSFHYLESRSGSFCKKAIMRLEIICILPLQAPSQGLQRNNNAIIFGSKNERSLGSYLESNVGSCGIFTPGKAILCAATYSMNPRCIRRSYIVSALEYRSDPASGATRTAAFLTSASRFSIFVRTSLFLSRS